MFYLNNKKNTFFRHGTTLHDELYLSGWLSNDMEWLAKQVIHWKNDDYVNLPRFSLPFLCS